MLYRALHSAASGMDAHTFNLDVIANNLANAGTTGFKRSRTDFQDLFYQYQRLPGQTDLLGQVTGIGVNAGLGTRVVGTQLDFQQGSIIDTGKETDLAIIGDGFFQVSDGGTVYYTRNGSLTKNANGQLIIASADKGRTIDPPITIPQDAYQISVAADGTVSVLQAGSTTASQVGNIQMVRFVNPEGLIQKGDSLYQQSDASGAPQPGTPGQQGLGLLKQGSLETSNTEPVRELVDLIKTQRNVELNSQVLQASDQLLQLVANLRRA